MKIKIVSTVIACVALLCSSSFAIEDTTASATLTTPPPPTANGIGQVVAPVVVEASPSKTLAVVPPPAPPPKPRYKFLGASFDFGLPSGVALGVVGRVPEVPWFKLGLSATGALSPGVRGSVLFDPIHFGIAPVAGVALGHAFDFKVPGVSNSPSVEYSYANLNAGLAFGNRDGFRFLVLSGASYWFGDASNFQALIGKSANGLVIGNPSFHAWTPNLLIGFQWLL